jgi:hypothetical protein
MIGGIGFHGLQRRLGGDGPAETVGRDGVLTTTPDPVRAKGNSTAGSPALGAEGMSIGTGRERY